MNGGWGYPCCPLGRTLLRPYLNWPHIKIAPDASLMSSTGRIPSSRGRPPGPPYPLAPLPILASSGFAVEVLPGAVVAGPSKA
eukprot:scaffold3702_cov22-Cyclotella_meneghiniana.AAC.1